MEGAPDVRGPGDLRCSDTDRERVAEALREAAGEGRLTLSELEERLEATFKARTYGDLQPITRDLPQGTTVVLLCDDPVARVDVRAWAWLRGHAVEVAEAEGWTVYTVRVGCADPEPPPDPEPEDGGTAAARST